MADTRKTCMCSGLFRKKAANPDHGRVMIPSLNRMISFRVVRPNAVNPDSQSKGSDSKGGAPKESPAHAPCLLTTPAVANDGKVHVMWNVDIAEVKERLGDMREAKEETDNSTESKTSNLSMQKTCTPRFGSVLDSPLNPAYDDGQCIEYFSVRHQQWMGGTMSVECLGEAVCHSVTLTHGSQLRPNVRLDLIRTPFRPGDLVDLFSVRKGGQRLPAVIAAEQLPSPSLLGYRVVVEGSGATFDRIPPLRLKRRFPRGQDVEVYRGSDLGWQKMQVHHTASLTGCEATLLPAPDAPLALAADVQEVKTIMLTPRVSKSFQPSNHNQKQVTASDVGLWTSVPVCPGTDVETQIESPELESSRGPEFVPSYLVRLPLTCTP